MLLPDEEQSLLFANMLLFRRDRIVLYLLIALVKGARGQEEAKFCRPLDLLMSRDFIHPQDLGVY